MQYTTCMTMVTEEKLKLSNELIKIHHTLIPLILKVSEKEDALIDKDLLWGLDQNLCDLSNVLRGQYEISGLVLVLYNNTLCEAKGQIREVISVLKNEDMGEADVIKDALDNIEHLFVLYRG